MVSTVLEVGNQESKDVLVVMLRDEKRVPCLVQTVCTLHVNNGRDVFHICERYQSCSLLDA